MNRTILIVALMCAEILASTRLELKESKFNQSEKILSRDKRYLLYVPNGGTAKFVSGFLGPIDIPLWQNINCLRNIQYQYPLPQNWTTFSSFPGFESVGNSSPSQGRHFGGEKSKVKPKPDSSRQIAYDLMETQLNKEGKNGHECMLRAICEIAETPVSHNGLVGELIQLFFTPGRHEKIQDDYIYARKAGLNRVDCEQLYPDCPLGHGILDSFSIIKNFEMYNWLNFK
ncbi:CLUMA_CG014259, isoform A [Clunio marinus]|uniref:CLUMA_CG014259, isoform A n=1 Tax=Clunio marinus TaxID=568069 RepID=A0A1J1INI6_9DIPT|nr:CLUMA_CG014259, isoform A [Clunio marinus]